MSEQIRAVSRESEDDPESRPALPPANFDFLIYSLRVQTELNSGLLPFGSFADEDGGARFGLARFRFLQIQEEESKPE
jgi:hypothetical protein